MALQGQRFELDLDSDNWNFDIKENEEAAPNVISGIKEREATDVPSAPTLKSSKTGFPEHRPRKQSAFKQQRSSQTIQPKNRGPSDRAILHHATQKRGIDLASAKERAEIDAENRNKISQMSIEDLEQARAELMSQFNPDKLQAFLRRANVDGDKQKQEQDWDTHEANRPDHPGTKSVAFAEPSSPENILPESESDDESHPYQPTDESIPTPLSSTKTHFPQPPRNKADYLPLDPSSDTFLADLKTHYFPELPHDPSSTSLSWLRDPTAAEAESSPYNPDNTGFAPSSLRFDFKGALLTPTQSLEIPTQKGLHHHGDAPHSAGYTIPELTLLARSTLPNQRCVAYQVMGRILFRLGRGDFGARGGELVEGLWSCIERERIVEIMMAEANREGKGTHQSAKAYATEALWLWRRGGGGDRGVLKEGERRAT